MKEVLEVCRTLIIETLVDKKSNFVVDAVYNREPVKFTKDGSYMIKLFLLCDQFSSCVLDPLEFGNDLFTAAIQKAIIMVKFSSNKGMDQCSCVLIRKIFPNFSNVPNLGPSSTTYGTDMLIKFKSCVKVSTNVPGRC